MYTVNSYKLITKSLPLFTISIFSGSEFHENVSQITCDEEDFQLLFKIRW